MKIFSKDTKKMLKHFTKYKKYQIILFILFIITMLISLVQPYILKIIIDKVISLKKINLIIPIIILGIVVILCERGVAWLLNYSSVKYSNIASKQEQEALYKYVQKIPQKHFIKYSTGDFLTRILSDIPEITSISINSIPLVIAQSIYGITVISHLNLQQPRQEKLQQKYSIKPQAVFVYNQTACGINF